MCIRDRGVAALLDLLGDTTAPTAPEIPSCPVAEPEPAPVSYTHLDVYKRQLDTIAWRYNIPEAFYPEALIPGRREIGTRAGLNLWGNVYPRGGFLHQTDDYKSGAVVAQRAGDIVTRRGQIHVYQPLLANARDGYWPAGALMETDASTGKWQELTPTLSNSCVVFPHSRTRVPAQQGDYAWALWRPYSCCRRRGQVFLGSVDFM